MAGTDYTDVPKTDSIEKDKAEYKPKSKITLKKGDVVEFVLESGEVFEGFVSNMGNIVYKEKVHEKITPSRAIITPSRAIIMAQESQDATDIKMDSLHLVNATNMPELEAQLCMLLKTKTLMFNLVFDNSLKQYHHCFIDDCTDELALKHKSTRTICAIPVENAKGIYSLLRMKYNEYSSGRNYLNSRLREMGHGVILQVLSNFHDSLSTGSSAMPINKTCRETLEPYLTMHGFEDKGFILLYRNPTPI